MGVVVRRGRGPEEVGLRPQQVATSRRPNAHLEGDDAICGATIAVRDIDARGSPGGCGPLDGRIREVSKLDDGRGAP